ncbi:MAG: 23S rRNA (uracil(1939)-C(5))-methyltransferase RlmD [Lachnospiraceae bacterium]|nr:23S rRNA (uracil(1939)-C(5))-methyltransferase RlmD [Lachnospiraceae bacterium]
MKKGQEYTGIVEKIKFPNKGVVRPLAEDGRPCPEEGVCIVKNVIPGQKIRFRVNKKRSGQCEGFLLEVVERAPIETDSACPHFDSCGGCSYQTLPYEQQLKIKDQQVHALLEPVLRQFLEKSDAGTDSVDIRYLFEEIVPSPSQFEYRNKMEFSFGDSRRDGELELGLHKRGSFYDIVTVRGCRIVDNDFRMILTETLAYFRGKDTPYFHKRTHEGYLRFLLVRKAAKTGEILIDLVTTSQTPPETICTQISLLEDWKDSLLELKLSGKIAGILHTVDDRVADAIANDHTEVLYGRDWFNEEVLGLRFKITPFSFFQTNTLSAEVLYSKVREYADHAGVVYDLYSGTGTIGQLMSTNAKSVIGVEIVEEAVDAANENALSNGLHNCKFIAGDVLKVLDEIEEKPDLIILDPPRDGINPKALTRIIDYGVDNIIYVSCKPTSLARDLVTLMNGGYVHVRICPIDQFPGTVHTEVICALKKTKG